MKSESLIKTDSQLLQAPTTIYADQLAQLAVGPFVSKLTFGIDKAVGEIPIPNICVTLPTVALLNLANQILMVLGNQQAQEGLKNEVMAYVAALPKPESK